MKNPLPRIVLAGCTGYIGRALVKVLLGSGYSISNQYGFIDFNSSYSNQTVILPWIPNKDRTDTYNVSVEVTSSINVNLNNNV